MALMISLVMEMRRLAASILISACKSSGRYSVVLLGGCFMVLRSFDTADDYVKAKLPYFCYSVKMSFSRNLWILL
jgi:hypothetical protein